MRTIGVAVGAEIVGKISRVSGATTNVEKRKEKE